MPCVIMLVIVLTLLSGENILSSYSYRTGVIVDLWIPEVRPTLTWHEGWNTLSNRGEESEINESPKGSLCEKGLQPYLDL